jgi:hypothetical protein
MDCKMITDLEVKHGVKIKQVFIPDAPSHGYVYGVYKKGYGLHTFISYVAEEHNHAKRILEFTIMSLQSKLDEMSRCKMIEATA